MRPAARRLAAIGAALVLAYGCGEGGANLDVAHGAGETPTRAPLDLALRPDAASGKLGVEVAGLSSAELDSIRASQLEIEEWIELFPVRVASAGDGAPPVGGNYAVLDDRLRFEPRYPFARDLKLVVEIHFELVPGPSPRLSMRKELFVPPAAPTPVAAIEAVYPSGDVLPQNLLKLYLHFSAPMGRGEAYERIQLVDAKTEQPVKFPFLELPEELWDAGATRLTILFEPGRVKRGLQPHIDEGPPLVEGREYLLVISADWRDARGRPLAAGFTKAFRTGAPDREQPDPERWTIAAPRAGATDALEVTFPEPLDHALLQHALAVRDSTGRTVAGAVEVDAGETRWRFTPERAWRAGGYTLVVDTVLEDRAGNSVGRRFETQGAGAPIPATVELPFAIKAR